MADSFDLVILGAGPAGLAAALRGAQQGNSVLVLSKRRVHDVRLGETLSSAAARGLRQLGVWERFVREAHLPCHGYLSSWGSSRLEFHSFVTDPRGHAWHLDRALFEQGLREEAEQRGVTLGFSTATPHLRESGNDSRGAGYFTVEWKAREGPRRVNARWAIDASGRAAMWARSLGASRILSLEQRATVGLSDRVRHDFEERSSLVEAVEDGFWYSALLSDRRLAVLYFSDVSLVSEEDWRTRLLATRHTRRRIEKAAVQFTRSPRSLAANSEYTTRVAGRGWRAVGDAALTYDPIAAHGVTFALSTGRDAVDSLREESAGVADAARQYSDRIERARRAYEARQRALYRAEQRFGTHSFWRRRVEVCEPRTVSC